MLRSSGRLRLLLPLFVVAMLSTFVSRQIGTGRKKSGRYRSLPFLCVSPYRTFFPALAWKLTANHGPESRPVYVAHFTIIGRGLGRGLRANRCRYAGNADYSWAIPKKFRLSLRMVLNCESARPHTRGRSDPAASSGKVVDVFVFVTGSKPQIDKVNCVRAWFRGASVWVSRTMGRTQKKLTKNQPSQNFRQNKRNSNASAMPARATKRRKNQRELARIPPKTRGGPLEQRSTAT
jgi:hypothetical protein